MDIDNLLNEIIPPPDYHHREGFTNEMLIDKLTPVEKREIENALIYKLSNDNKYDVDTLIVTTLSYLKSQKSLTILKSLIATTRNQVSKLIIASSIYEICAAEDMIDIAISCLKKIDNKFHPGYVYNLIACFYYLAKFQSKRTNNLIKNYVNHKEYLVSYNAKRFFVSSESFLNP